MTNDKAQQMEQLSALLGDTDDAAAALANHVVSHMGNRVSALGLPAYAFIQRWAITLGSERLLAFAAHQQKMVALAHPPKDAVKALEALALHDYLKGVQIMGGGK